MKFPRARWFIAAAALGIPALAFAATEATGGGLCGLCSMLF